MTYGSGINSTASIIPDYTGSGEQKASRRIISQEESDQAEKTLNILAGRVAELRERLGRVLIPAGTSVSGNKVEQPVESASPLTDRLRIFQRLAQESIDGIDDILARLDV